jgi:hypothetical protein
VLSVLLLAVVAGAIVDVVFNYLLAEHRSYDACTHLLIGAFNGGVIAALLVVLGCLVKLAAEVWKTRR